MIQNLENGTEPVSVTKKELEQEGWREVNTFGESCKIYGRNDKRMLIDKGGVVLAVYSTRDAVYKQ